MNKLITFEGVDGCGKSTQLRRAAAYLRDQGCDVVTTFEPGDTSLGKEIRRLLLAGEFVPVAEAELLLFLADRAQHVHEVIQPALASGAWVLCDRYSDSTLAYQLAARKLGDAGTNPCNEILNGMLSFAECGVSPGLTLWFDVAVDEAMRRMQQRVKAGEKSTRLDDEAVSFHERVAAAFVEQFSLQPERIARIDAGVDMDAVAQQVEAVLKQRFEALA
ncbi:MAG: dTMP kinase [Mariprofundus sp.]|nr:dTMP kinase [Mariprofundus sp.]